MPNPFGGNIEGIWDDEPGFMESGMAINAGPKTKYVWLHYGLDVCRTLRKDLGISYMDDLGRLGG